MQVKKSWSIYHYKLTTWLLSHKINVLKNSFNLDYYFFKLHKASDS